MRFIITFIFFHLLFLAYTQNYSKCKVWCTDQEMIQLDHLGIPVDHGTRKKNTSFISDFSSSEIEKMRLNGFQVEVIIDDVQSFYRNQEREAELLRNASCQEANNYQIPTTPSNFSLGSMAGFFTYEEFISQLDLMASLYPDLITVKDTIDSYLSIEGRPIYWVKISDQATTDEPEPEILYTSIHHAREPGSLSSTLYYMWYLLENYASNPEIKYLVDETELYFVPMVNPDGYHYNQSTEPNGGGMWRKNRRMNQDGTFGVDLNRNYSYGWGTTGISFDTNSDVYPGTGAFSEPETQAIKWFCEQRDFSFAFNAHTFSNLILFPIGTQINEFAEDHSYFLSIASYMVQYSNFIAQKSSDLYPASGDSDDYMYLEDLTLKPKIFAFTPEIGTDNDGFWPTENRIIPLCEEMFFPNLMLAHAAHNYWIVNDLDNQTLTSMSGTFNHQVQRIGLDETPLQVSIEPLAGIQSIGTPVSYTLGLNEISTGSISYTLLPSIQFGQEIKYVLVSDFGAIQKRDTIFKIFGNPSLLYLDEASNIQNWTGNWGLTSEDFTSPDFSFTDSPSQAYSNFTTKTFQFVPVINLSSATAAKVEFSAKWSIENNYDYTAFEVSTDNGQNWTPQCGKFTNTGTSADGSVQPEGKPIYDGAQTSWLMEEISLNDYLGQQILVRFILKSDGGVTEDGFYFDDFKLFANGGSLTSNGIDETDVNTGINLFPNPASDQLIISLPSFSDDVSVEITDLNGKQVLSASEQGNFNVLSLSITDLETGSYMVHVTMKGQEKMTKKLMVIK